MPDFIQNARIKATRLGFEDRGHALRRILRTPPAAHGIFTAWIELDYGSAGQGFGGYALDGKPDRREADSRRPGTAYGCDFILELLRTLEVGLWERLPGTYCRVRSTKEGFGGVICAIGHPLKERWFDPRALAARHGVDQSD